MIGRFYLLDHRFLPALEFTVGYFIVRHVLQSKDPLVVPVPTRSIGQHGERGHRVSYFRRRPLFVRA